MNEFFLKFTVKKLLSFFYPSFCRACKLSLDDDTILCDECGGKIRNVASLFLPITKSKVLPVFALGRYDEPLRTLILRKFSSDLLASKDLAKLILDKSFITKMHFDFIVPVPLHIMRYASRGFNQAFEIAKEIGVHLDCPVLDIVKRVKFTKFQSSLPWQSRRDNVKNAFSINEKIMKNYKDRVFNKDILIIDDLCTTGSTLQNVAKSLLLLKPKSLTAFVACRKC